MGSNSDLVHILLVSFPEQGNVNPLLRLGKHLASDRGWLVTFSTAESFVKNMRKATNNNISDQPTPVGYGFIKFEFFDDGWDDDDPRRLDIDQYLTQLELFGKPAISRIIKKNAKQGRPVSCLINNFFIPWVFDVASSLDLPCATLWVESCACFATYYHYFHGLVSFPDKENPELDVQLPHMPLLKHDEVPSMMHPTTSFPSLGREISGQFKNLDKAFCILMNTFQELEHEIIDYMSKIFPIETVGPLFKNPKALRISTDVSCDFFKKVDDCIEWLDTKPLASVVYVSFGSMVYLRQDQWDELAYGLLNSGLPFLLVMRPPHNDSSYELVLPHGFLEKVGDKGKVVQWSPQEKVLGHPSVACFVTHCGWNSSMEALAFGVPVVPFPQWGDQVTNAKYLVDIFKVGVGMGRGEGEKRLITRDEIEKCLHEATMGPKVEKIKQNALKWKKMAEAAVAEGGSSDRNIKGFADLIESRRLEGVSKSITGNVDLVNKSTTNDAEFVEAGSTGERVYL